MDTKLRHELAIAYAQARLTRKQFDAETPPSEEELYCFYYDYQFAIDNIAKQVKSYPRL